MELAPIDTLPMGLGKVCTCRNDHWERNISALCHGCGGHIHPLMPSSPLLDETRDIMSRMYDIKPVAYDAEQMIQSGLQIFYGMQSKISTCNYQITHSGKKPYRYSKKAPPKIGVVLTVQERNSDSHSVLSRQVRACKLLLRLNREHNAKHAHNKLFAFAPELGRPTFRFITAPVPYSVMSSAWHLIEHEYSRGHFEFVFDRRDFTPTLLAKFLTFWNKALRNNDGDLFTSGEYIGRQRVSRCVTDIDYCARMADIPYIDTSVGITHPSTVDYDFTRKDSVHQLMNRNHFSLKLMSLCNWSNMEIVVNALECSLYYLREVSMRNVARRDLTSMSMWASEEGDRNLAYRTFIERMSHYTGGHE